MARALIVCGFLLGCGRPSVASFVPSLELGVRFTRQGDAYDERSAAGSQLTGFARLSFRPRPAASALPAMSDASGIALATPCADGDVACLDELAETEAELAPLAGDDR
jgi:hypothetical protein